MSCAAAILAGGRSSRLGGVPKGLIEISGEVILERLLAALRPRFAPLLLIADDPTPYRRWRELLPHHDHAPGKGAPGGVLTALRRAPAGWVFVCACDLPWLDGPTIDHLARRLPESAAAATPSAVLYRAAGRVQPLAGFWHTRAAGSIERLLPGNPSFRAILREVGVELIEAEDPSPFTNLNRPADLAAAGAALPLGR